MKKDIHTSGSMVKNHISFYDGIWIICNTENFVPIVVPDLSSSSSSWLPSSTSMTLSRKEIDHPTSSSISCTSPVTSPTESSENGARQKRWDPRGMETKHSTGRGTKPVFRASRIVLSRTRRWTVFRMFLLQRSCQQSSRNGRRCHFRKWTFWLPTSPTICCSPIFVLICCICLHPTMRIGHEKNAMVKSQETKQRVQRFFESVGNGKPTGSVWKETIAISATKRISVEKLHHQIRLQNFSCSRMSENHREPEIQEAEVPSGRTSRWPCKDYLKEFFNNSFCKKMLTIVQSLF